MPAHAPTSVCSRNRVVSRSIAEDKAERTGLLASEPLQMLRDRSRKRVDGSRHVERKRSAEVLCGARVNRWGQRYSAPSNATEDRRTGGLHRDYFELPPLTLQCRHRARRRVPRRGILHAPHNGPRTPHLAKGVRNDILNQSVRRDICVNHLSICCESLSSYTIWHAKSLYNSQPSLPYYTTISTT